MNSKAIVLCLSIFMGSFSWNLPSVSAQVKKWDSHNITNHVIGTINIDTSALCTRYSKSEFGKKILKKVMRDNNLDLEKTDQLQVIMMVDPKLALEPDNTAYVKVTYKQPLKIDQALIKSITKYRTTVEKYQGEKVYLGTNSGFWGGMKSSDRSIILAVPSTLKSLLDHRTDKLPEEHQLEKIKRKGEMLITLTGGEVTKKFAKAETSSNRFRDVLNHAASASLSIDLDSKRPLFARVKPMKDSSLEKLKKSVEKVSRKGRFDLGIRIGFSEARLDDVTDGLTKNLDMAHVKMLRSIVKDLNQVADYLKSLKIEKEQDSIVIYSTDKEATEGMIKLYFKTYIGR